MNLKIKKLQSDEVSRFVALHLFCWQETYQHYFPKTVFESREKTLASREKHVLHHLADSNLFYFAIWDDFHMIGILILSKKGNKGLIDAIYLKQEYCHMGIGHQMFQMIQTIFRHHGIKMISVFLLKGIVANEIFAHWNFQKVSEEYVTIHHKDYLEYEYEFPLEG